MDYNITCSGMNMKQDIDNFIFKPFITNTIIFIKSNKKTTLSFNIFHNGIEIIKIYKKNFKKEIIDGSTSEIKLIFEENEIIKIVPKINQLEDTFIKLILNKENIIDYTFITSNNLSQLSFDEKFINKNNIIISLTSIPSRIMNNKFVEIIDGLYNQKIKPKYIIINLCKQYRRKFNYNPVKFNTNLEKIKKKYENVIINMCDVDYGPITKIMGLIDFKEFNFEPNDQIIVVDDDWIHLDILTYVYEKCYQMYDCDAVFINERDCIKWDKNYTNNMNILDNKIFYYDNYQNFVFGWLTFSFKYKTLSKLKKFYNNVCKIDKDILIHDDLILTLFYKYYKINACGIGVILNKKEGTILVETNALKNDYNAHLTRYNLETKFLDMFGYKYTVISKYLLYLTNEDVECEIEKKKYKYSIKSEKNGLVDVNIINSEFVILTIYYDTKIITNDTVKLSVNNNNFIVVLSNNNFSNKQTYLIKINNNCNII